MKAMRVSTKVEFGIIALADIAVNSANGEIVTVNSIAQRQNISVKYLEQIFTALRQAKIVTSRKGSQGGYSIAAPVKKINFKSILNALDVSILSDVDFEATDSGSEYVSVIDDLLWKNMTGYLNDYSEKITLDDVIKLYNQRKSSEQEEMMYYI